MEDSDYYLSSGVLYVPEKARWDYIELELERRREFSHGIIFPRMPRSKCKLILIEKVFEERGIPVVWMNESIEETRNR